MSKKIIILAVATLGLLILVNTTEAAVKTGSNLVNVTSCEQVGSDIRIKNFGRTYTLTSTCRNAGHGNRQYVMSCTSPTSYRVSWAEGCTPNAIPKPTPVPAPAPAPIYSKSPVVNIWVPNGGETGRREISASASGCIAGEYITKVQFVEDNNVVKTCNNSSACSYFMTNSTNQNVTHDVYALAYCSGSVVGGYSKNLHVVVAPLNNNPVTVTSSARYFIQDGINSVELAATAKGNNNIYSIELYWSVENNKTSGGLVKKCFAYNTNTHTCTFSYPIVFSRGGFWWAKVWYNNGANSTETDLNYYHF